MAGWSLCGWDRFCVLLICSKVALSISDLIESPLSLKTHQNLSSSSEHKFVC